LCHGWQVGHFVKSLLWIEVNKASKFLVDQAYINECENFENIYKRNVNENNVNSFKPSSCTIFYVEITLKKTTI
jgi:hypothetical protein